ncbi:unnamed protein product [Lepidochelys olivacea]
MWSFPEPCALRSNQHKMFSNRQSVIYGLFMLRHTHWSSNRLKAAFCSQCEFPSQTSRWSLQILCSLILGQEPYYLLIRLIARMCTEIKICYSVEAPALTR